MQGQCGTQRLVIFDYSGTLSIEAPDFGKPGNLVRTLAESGLAACGVADPDIFWERIVFPTWDESSRTGIGFAKSMADRIAALPLPIAIASEDNTPSPTGQAHLASTKELSYASIAEAAGRFVSMYLAHSRPEPLWMPLLKQLQSDAMVTVVVATDHYAEATAAIIRYLHDWGITARRIEHAALSTDLKHSAVPGNQPPPFLVANSADLGFWKAEQGFWKIVSQHLPCNFNNISIVDDFGFHEADVHGYGMLLRVRKRRIETRTAIKDVFRTNLSVLPFLINRWDDRKQDAIHERILKKINKINDKLFLDTTPPCVKWAQEPGRSLPEECT